MNKIGLIISSLLLAWQCSHPPCLWLISASLACCTRLARSKKSLPSLVCASNCRSRFKTWCFLDRRVLTLDSPETGSIQTAEKKNLVVDWLVKWRIADAKQFIRNNSGGANISTAEQRLTSVVQDALNSEVTKRTVKDVLSTDRDKIMQGVQQRLVDDAKTFGIEIVDVRIKRVDFPAQWRIRFTSV